MLLLIVLALASLALGVAAAKTPAATPIFGVAKTSPNALRAYCATPATLRLARFEDGSAQLKCASRILVRISVPS